MNNTYIIKEVLIRFFCLLPFFSFSQNVSIPDTNFKACLIADSLINTNGDSEIQISEASSYNGIINCSNQNINDLTGIEEFIMITELRCHNNQLSSLNLNQNTLLETLWCQDNNITNLDVSTNIDLTYINCKINQLSTLDITNNISLSELWCQDNNLTSLNISNNILLNYLNCGENLITTLDVSHNIAMYDLYCYNNKITNLDLSQNINLTTLRCENNYLTSLNLHNGNNINMLTHPFDFKITNNPQLYCINVDDSAWASSNWTTSNGNIDSTMFFSINCSVSLGCTDSLACNYDSLSTINNNSCRYPAIAPYYESFSSGFLPQGDSCNWLQSAIIGDGWRFNGLPGYAAAYNGRDTGSYAWIDFSNQDSSVILEIETIDISNLVIPGLFFDLYSFVDTFGNSPPLNILNIETWDGTSWIWQGSYQLNNPVWTTQFKYLNNTAYINNLVKIRFRAESSIGADYFNDLLIDNVKIQEILLGCIDSLACNYNSFATIDDSSCVYQNTYSYDTLYVNTSIIWNGITLNISGDYTDTLINSAGCDSIAYLNLNITQPDAFIYGNDTICFNQNIDAIVKVSFNNGTPPFSFTYEIDGIGQPPITTSINPYIILTQQGGIYNLSSFNDLNGIGTLYGSAMVTVITSTIDCPPLSIVNELALDKKLLKVTDILGRETKQKNQLLLYLYDDGSVEKKVVLE